MLIVSIKRRGIRPNWYLYWIDGLGRPKFKTTKFPVVDFPEFKSCRELEVLRARTQTQLNDGLYSPKKNKPRLTFGEVVAQFIADPVIDIKANRTFETRVQYELNKMVVAFGSRLIQQMTAEEVARWFKAKLNAPATERRNRETRGWSTLAYKGHFNQVFKYAIKKGYMDSNLIEQIVDENPRFFPSQPKGRWVELKASSMKALGDAMAELEAVETPSCFPMRLFRDIFHFREFTGTRIYEALRLRVEDLLPDGRIHIRAGKTDEARTLPVIPYVAAIAQRHSDGKGPKDLIFTWNGRPLEACNLRKTFERVRKLASKAEPGLSQMHLYDLRHLALTRLAEQHMGESLIASYAGHATTRMTRTYINLAEDQLQQVPQAFEAYLPKGKIIDQPQRDFAISLPLGKNG